MKRISSVGGVAGGSSVGMLLSVAAALVAVSWVWAQPATQPSGAEPEGTFLSAAGVQDCAAWRLKSLPQLEQEIQTRQWPEAAPSVPLNNELQSDFRIPQDWAVVKSYRTAPSQQGWVVKAPDGQQLVLSLHAREALHSPVLNSWTVPVLSNRLHGIDQEEVAAWKKLSDLEFAQVIIDSRKWLREGSPIYQQRKAVLFVALFEGMAPYTVRYENEHQVALVGPSRKSARTYRLHSGQEGVVKPSVAACVTLYNKESGRCLFTFSLGTSGSFLNDADFLGLVERCLAGLGAD